MASAKSRGSSVGRLDVKLMSIAERNGSARQTHSAPVPAGSAIRSRVTPRKSTFARPATPHRVTDVGRRHVVGENDIGAGADGFVDLRQCRLRLGVTPGFRRAFATAAPTRLRRAMWLS
jgi:hypothetical protein